MSIYDPQPDEAEAVLRKLSPAQFRAARSGTLDPKRPGYLNLRTALWERGVFTTADRKDVLTPLGKEVQALIRKRLA